MRNLLGLLLLLTNCCFAQTADDNMVMVGNPAQPVAWVHRNSIREAILRAGSTGIVWIPATYTGTDCSPISTCSPGSTQVIDLRAGSLNTTGNASFGGSLTVGTGCYGCLDGTAMDLAQPQFNGDLGNRIALGITQLQTSAWYAATLDARSLRGGATAAIQPFASLVGTGYSPNVSGTVLLPQGVIKTCQTWWVPGGWTLNGEGPMFGLTPSNSSPGTTIQANPTCFLPAYSDLNEGSVSTSTCTTNVLGSFSCTVTGIGTHFRTKVQNYMFFVLCTVNTTGLLCGANNASNIMNGVVTAITDDTHLTITTRSGYTGSAGTNSFVFFNPGLVMGDDSGSAGQPANFGVHINNLTYDCAGVQACGGFANFNAQNLATYANILVYPGPHGAAFDMSSGGGPQNSGPNGPSWVIGHTGQCDAFTTGFFYRGSSAAVLGTSSISVALTQCAANTGVGSGNAAVVIDGLVAINGIHVLTNASAGSRAGYGIAMGFAIPHPAAASNPPQAVNGSVIIAPNCQSFGLTCLAIGNAVNSFGVNIQGVILGSPPSNYTNLFSDINNGCNIPAGTTPGVSESTLSYATDITGNLLNSTSHIPGCNGMVINGVIQASGFIINQGSLCGSGNVVLGSGWGTGSTTTAFSGSNSCMFTINSGAASFTANPTVTYTLPNALPTAMPCSMNVYAQTSGNPVIMFFNNGQSATAPQFTATLNTGATFTPAASENYTVLVRCGI